MKLNLTKAFGEATEEIPVADPWGAGVTFYVRPATHPEAIDKTFGESGSIMDDLWPEIVGRGAKARLRAMAHRQEKRVGPKDGAATDEAEPVADQEEAEEENILTRAMEEAIDALDPRRLGEVVRERRKVPDAQKVADGLLVRWEGLVDDETNEEVEFSRAAAVELLEDSAVVPAGHEYGGMRVGEALRQHLVEASRGAVLALSEAAEEVEKNSGSSCGSESDSSESSDRTSETSSIDN